MKAAAAFNLACLLLGTSGHIAVSGFSSSSFTKPYITSTTGTCNSSARGSPLFDKKEGTIQKESPNIDQAAENVLSVAQDCFDNSATGVFLSIEDTKRCEKAVAELEAVSSALSADVVPSDLVGDWHVVCITSMVTAYPASFFSSFNMNPHNIMQKAVKVVQRISKVENNEKDDVAFDQVENLIEIAPRVIEEEIQAQLEKLPFGNFLPPALLNPLGVTSKKISLVHKASMSRSGDKSFLRTKVSPKCITLNLAGQNTQFLKPDGADVLGFNIPYPLGDLLQSGTFDTTFVNGEIHVARCSIGGITALMVLAKEKQ
jgi:hypothetical protein